MPLGTLDRTPPPFFKQGPSALSKLMVCSALALFLMVADSRFRITQPVRAAVATVLFPIQWIALWPVKGVQGVQTYLTSLNTALHNEEIAHQKLLLMSQRANQVEQLANENAQLRKLLGLRERLNSPSLAAEVLYDAADPYTRKVVIDKGLAQGVEAGSPVIDESGVLGQVTRVHPLIAEVTLVTDSDQAIPVVNTRTGTRGIVYGDAGRFGSGGLELRYMAANADVQVNDLLTTSGVDGVYPAGIPVAKVAKVERRPDSAFAKIVCYPQSHVDGARHVMVLRSLLAQMPPRPAPEDPAPLQKRGRK
ncbi:rod shape-determining protein MreC [Ramlibacter sp.]|jgi:rod shape-determining protein MreC|uniref:rod shape-determining protein MreC n=1 Tax=Ramlibacter sp. TaxID=1917967 RepID=UPI00262969EA|nr:rod shape-determining protein MreC [Ramlibacter sp.]MDB5954262.1 mreC [Ramlibacter sp.]